MDFEFLNKKDPNGKGKKKPEGAKFSSSIVGAVFIFMLITAVYLVFSGDTKKTPEISISELAKSMILGDVKKIVVEGEDLNITYKDDTIKKSKKEAGTSLSDTLSNYGVGGTTLANTEIEIKNESGFVFWLVNVLPILLPVIFVILFSW